MRENPPVIALAGAPPWADDVTNLLRRHGFEPRRYADPAGYVEALAHDQAALVLVDGTGEGWAFWTTAPKVEQATRRVPVIVIAPDAGQQQAAIRAGADLTLPPDQIGTVLLEQIERLARVPDPAEIERLDCQCREALPPLAQDGIRKFNAGAYYAQHDAFETQWMAEPGPVRDLYRAILQVGVAYYHITRGNHAGALKMLLRSVQWLARLPDVCQGVDVRQLREDAAAVRAALLALDPAEISTFDRALLRPIRLLES